MLFADDAVYVDKSADKWERWGETLESKQLRVIVLRHMECKFTNESSNTDIDVIIGSQNIPQKDHFK